MIWVSDALTETFLMRLKEFERRGQLGGGVKTVVVPFNFVTFTRQKADSIKWSWYKELPVSVRYLDMLPCSKLEFARYIACNLRYPLPMLLQSGFPKGRTSIARLPERRREKNLSMFENEGRSIVLGKDSLPNWEGRIFGAYREMKEICTRNGTGFAILRMPVLPQYRNATGDDVRELEDEFVKRFRNDGMEVLEVKVDLTAADFFDNVHLVESGRAVLTERVIARLAELNRR
ncbi:MAG: hypothetical protein J6T01_00290 [Kiritimatiellae bacterium]|nr:hypothetical protein [Kiritimatiellia bacterium]